MTADFPIASDINPAVRRAALTLYAANTEDREWLMSRLPGRDRPLLEKMLSELASLGMPRDPSMVRSALRELPQTAEPPFGEPQNAARLLQTMDADALADVLHREPPVLVACALALTPLRIGAMVLDRLPPALRRQVQSIRDAAPSGSAPPRLRAALLKQLQERLPASESCQRPWAKLWQYGAAVARFKRMYP